MHPNMIKKIDNYRREINQKGGVVILYNNAIQGWSHNLCEPERSIPGCIAINEEGKQWEARGGNGYDGAEQWIPITPAWNGKTALDLYRILYR